MHIPDGFLAAPVWGGLTVVSVPAIAVAARRAQAQLEENRVPLMGVMGAFVFAAQMINFPVGAGASGHLVGGALLTATLGPAAASVVLTAILVIQALVFQDGGLLALGSNVFNMAIVGVLAAWLPYRALAGKHGRIGLFLSGFLSVFVSGCLCLSELGLSGVRLEPVPLGIAVMVFAITAAIEGMITVAVVAGLGRMNPHWLQNPARGGRPALAMLLSTALLLSAVGFLAASSLPDGLERFAGLAGIENTEWALFSSPFPDYEALTMANPWLRKALAGIAGLALTGIACLMIGRWIARLRSA